jgi:hypothetical protein
VKQSGLCRESREDCVSWDSRAHLDCEGGVVRRFMIFVFNLVKSKKTRKSWSGVR